jgi:hypothetical protein
MIKKLMIFERKILRRIFGPTEKKRWNTEDKTNEELDHLIKQNNIISQIESKG